ncbi:UNVERIFIED_CONTAM: hypothetical protein Scaly_3133300 [Sesamum calycinum]|uniref:Uncharacterized protein n=1 Tax=Sesamum calycinum TaxID=2727403 RepID=A0AAW2JH52_9LAMI
MKTRTRLPAANGIAPELLPSSSFSILSFLFFLSRGGYKRKACSTGRPFFCSLFESRFLFLYFESRYFPRKREASKASPGSEGKESLVTEVDYRTGVGKNLAKGSISDSSPTVN